MKTQKDLQMKLESICDHVYFRKPSKGMVYPCIKYDYSGDHVDHADNIAYNRVFQWSLTIIDENPNSELPRKLEEAFTYWSLDRIYEVQGLNHFVYRLYY